MLSAKTERFGRPITAPARCLDERRLGLQRHVNARSHPRGDLRWYQHGATGDLSRLQPRIDVDGLRQWKFRRLGVDPAVACHRNHFHQFDARAPVRNAHRRSVWRASVAELMAAAAQSDDRPDAVATEQLRAQIQRRLHPNAIENQASPAADQ